MAINTHISNWIDRSELIIDYYTQFIKVWIPFNAWYMHNFYDESSVPKRDTDAAIITHINSNSNIYRDKIKSLLRGNDVHSDNFRELISKLHFELEANPIPTFDDRISFSKVNLIKNTTTSHFIQARNLIYHVEFKHLLQRTQKRWILEVQRRNNSQTLFRVELHNWSEEELNNDVDFIALPNNEMRIKLREAFQFINPKKPVIIIPPIRTNRAGKIIQPNNSIVINKNRDLYFIEDYDLVSKVIVKLIYDLRCKLFHGETNPNSTNMKIYKYAYQIQKILIQDLK